MKAPRPALVAALAGVALVARGLAACEGRYAGEQPISPAELNPSPSGDPLALVDEPARDAAAAAASVSHAMVVMSCAWASVPCAGSVEDASVETEYRVVLGSGHASIRTRSQMMSDLYRELRDKLNGGQRLDAQPRSPGGSPARGAVRSVPQGASDPLTQCTFTLLDLVDTIGEVDLNVVYGAGVSRCLVSAGRTASDAGREDCLIHEPERGQKAPPGSALSW